MNNQPTNQPSWVSDVYSPEGADRPSHNPPVTRRIDPDADEAEGTVADIVAKANEKRVKKGAGL